MSEPTYTVLFLCQQNAGRSLMAETMLKEMGKGRFEAYSAGFEPANTANPVAMQVLQDSGYPTEHLRPKHYSVFLEDDAPHFDFVFALCVDSEQEAKVKVWDEMTDDTITATWHFADPSLTGVDEETELEQLKRIEIQLAKRIRLLLNLPEDKLDKIANPEPDAPKKVQPPLAHPSVTEVINISVDAPIINDDNEVK